MTLPAFKEDEDDYKGCQACGDDEATVDKATGLCRPCWRVVALGQEFFKALWERTFSGPPPKFEAKP